MITVLCGMCELNNLLGCTFSFEMFEGPLNVVGSEIELLSGEQRFYYIFLKYGGYLDKIKAKQ